jgi:hypothetical protein
MPEAAGKPAYSFRTEPAKPIAPHLQWGAK